MGKVYFSLVFLACNITVIWTVIEENVLILNVQSQDFVSLLTIHLFLGIQRNSALTIVTCELLWLTSLLRDLQVKYLFSNSSFL